jgi:phosphate transport system substrate-binding protein
MVTTLASTSYSIGYVGVSFGAAIAKNGLGTRHLKNQSGKFLVPTAETVSAAASELDPRTPPDERLSLVFAPGDNSYPLINYEYAVVSTDQASPETAAALRHFLLWRFPSRAATRRSTSTPWDSFPFQTSFGRSAKIKSAQSNSRWSFRRF